MTYGHWLDQTGSRLRRAATALQRLPADAPTMLAITDARSRVYRALARNIDLLTRHPYLRQPAEPHPARLYAALRQAANGSVDPTVASSRLAMVRAAESATIAADLLSTHIPPGQPARTSEGAAIRLGGGVVAALAHLARVALCAVDVDRAALSWLDTARPAAFRIAERLADAARASTSGPLTVDAQALIGQYGHRPHPLWRLETAPALGRPATAESDDVAAALNAARTWLWPLVACHHGLRIAGVEGTTYVAWSLLPCS